MPTYQQFPLPDVGEGLTEAEIVAWHVAVGDAVDGQPDDRRDRDREVARRAAQPVRRRRHAAARRAAGETVDVGTPIIEIDTDPGGAAAADGRRVPESEARIADDGDGAVEHGHRGRPDRHPGVEPGGPTRSWRHGRADLPSRLSRRDSAAADAVARAVGTEPAPARLRRTRGRARRAARCSSATAWAEAAPVVASVRPAPAGNARTCSRSRRCASWRRTSAST